MGPFLRSNVTKTKMSNDRHFENNFFGFQGSFKGGGGNAVDVFTIKKLTFKPTANFQLDRML